MRREQRDRDVVSCRKADDGSSACRATARPSRNCPDPCMKRAACIESTCDVAWETMMAAMKFYMTPGSCSTGIHIILEELEEVFEAHIVNLPAGDNFKPDYVAINPKSTIPALVRSDGSVLTEVPAIAYWLGRSRPRAKLWPSDLETETRLLEAMTYISGTVHRSEEHTSELQS